MNTPWNLLLKLRTALGDRPVLGTLVFSLTASLLAAQTGPLSVVTVTGSVAGRVFNQAPACIWKERESKQWAPNEPSTARQTEVSNSPACRWGSKLWLYLTRASMLGR